MGSTGAGRVAARSPAGGETLCEHGDRRRSRICGARSTACRGRRGSRCSRASARTRSSPAPTPTGAGSVRCWPPTAPAAARTASRSPERGTHSRSGRPGPRSRGGRRAGSCSCSRPTLRRACSTTTAPPPTWAWRSLPTAGSSAIARGTTDPETPTAEHELRASPGWAWLRIVRRYDEYERALALLESEHPAELQPSR